MMLSNQTLDMKRMTRRVPLFILTVFFHFSVFGQDIKIPNFKTNATAQDSAELKVVLDKTKDFDLAIMLKSYSNWGYIPDFIILGYANGNWQLLKNNLKDTGIMGITKDSFQAFPVSKAKCDSILEVILDNHVLTMNARALDSTYPKKVKVKRKHHKNSFYEYYKVSDGERYQIIIKTNQGLYLLDASSPEEYY
jgi:hypothetical protein